MTSVAKILQTMFQNMEPSRIFKPIDVEVEEIVKEIMEDGGIPCAEIPLTQYFIQHEDEDEDFLEASPIEAPISLSEILNISQTSTKKRKTSITEPILDYS